MTENKADGKKQVIVRYIILKIQANQFKDKLPSLGELSIKFDVSRAFIQLIYKKLLEMNIIVTTNNRYFISKKYINKRNYLNISEDEVENPQLTNAKENICLKRVYEHNKKWFKSEEFYHFSKEDENKSFDVFLKNIPLYPEEGFENILEIITYNGICIIEELIYIFNDLKITVLYGEEGDVQIVICEKITKEKMHKISEKHLLY